MNIFCFLLGVFQCFILWRLGRTGRRLTLLGNVEKQRLQARTAYIWPACALILPVAGNRPSTAAALRSLAEQDYPDFIIYMVTATADDSAAPIIDSLARAYGNIRHVVAGEAVSCGQKNYNILAGIEAAKPDAAIYAFCDSTHIAEPDFLRCLVAPLARSEAAFTTGYHVVEPSDFGVVTLGYTLSVLFMRFLQGSPGLAQPWGGAMAMTREAFARYGIAQLWASNVVDDCSLAAHLTEEGVRVHLCPGALLKTSTGGHQFPVWRAWLERQILFLKFCIPAQWWALGLVCLLMFIPPVWFIAACFDGIANVGGGTGPFLALCWFCALGWTIGAWRSFLDTRPPLVRWIMAFFCASFMFAFVYLGTLGKHTILWNNILYRVGRGGRVLNMRRR